MKTSLFMLCAILCVTQVGSAQAIPSSAGHTEAAMELFEVMHMESVFNDSMESMIKLQLEQNPELVPFEDTMWQFLTTYMSWGHMKGDLVKIYVEAFTEVEIREITAFYRTKTGQKAVELMPVLLNKGMALGQQRVQEHLGELSEMVMKRALELQQQAPQP